MCSQYLSKILFHKKIAFVVFAITFFALANAQSSKVVIDSISAHNLGFSSLFKVTADATKDKSFRFELNPKAVSFIQSYMEKQGPELTKMKTWAKPYFNLYDAILTKNGIPVELKYLSVIESHLSADLTSWAGAVGPWQIMPDEATRLGLKLTPTDERTDYYKSTQAAATILKELYAEFGDWLLVVAAYNGGAGRLRNVIKKKGTKDFWQLQYELPLETRNHVKKFIATHYVFEEDGSWITLTQSEANIKKGASVLLKDNLQELTVSGRFRISIIAQYLNLSEKELLILNPNFDKIVATGKSYQLKIPKDRLEIFEARKNDILQASLQSLYSIKE
jgi:membrane-bound lytic murein transglycosylase D